MKILLVMISSLLLTACASAPVQIKDSIPTHKLIRYPEVGQDKTVNAGETLYIFLDYQSNFKTSVFLEEPLTTSIRGMGASLDMSAPLLKATLDGREMYCSNKGKLSRLLDNPTAILCGVDSTKTGYFDRFNIRSPDNVWFEKVLDKKIKYREVEVESASNPQGPMNRDFPLEKITGNKQA